MTQVKLKGLRAHTLAGYLQGLGLLRVLSQQTEQQVSLHWSPHREEAVLSCDSTSEELTSWLVDDYAPSAIVTPWNAGSGFAANGKSPAAERVLESFRTSSEQRFASLRETIRAADAVVAEGRERGWAGKQLWEENRKRDVIQLCRNTFPDASLAWLDVAVTLTSDDIAYNPLTGTGGNFGRQDLSVTFFQRLAQTIGPSASRSMSRAWAEALLHGREDVPYLRDTVGQYDPGRAGGILSTPREKADDTGFVNPWAFVLTLEGTLLFASATTRRFRSSLHAAAWPFFVGSTAVGYDSAADEQTKGEQWVPLWSQPASLHDVSQLLGEGRVQWHGQEPRSGLEFALAIASYGVDRGLSAFRRFTIVNRLGQNPLAVPIGRVEVGARPLERMLQRPYDWIRRVKRMPHLPNSVASYLRVAEAEMFQVATTGDTRALAHFIVSFGHLHEAVSRSDRLQEKIPPYTPLGQYEDWLSMLPGDSELWIAAGFASLWDTSPGRGQSARFLLTPVERQAETSVWSTSTPAATSLTETTLAIALAEMHRQRAVSAQQLRSESRDQAKDPQNTAGSQLPFRNGVRVPVRLVEAFIRRDVDDGLIADYLRGLLVLGCASYTTATAPEPPMTPLPVPLALLLPHYATPSPNGISVRLARQPNGDKELPKEETSRPQPSQTAVEQLAPQLRWPAQLIAGQTTDVLRDSLLRLRLAGYPPALSPTDAAYAASAGGVQGLSEQQLALRLTAGLLLHTSKSGITESLRTACDITAVRFPTSNISDDKHESEGNPA